MASTRFIVLSVLCVVFLSSSCAAVWNQELGLRYLYFSYAAYCSQSSLTAWNCKFCNTNETSGFKPTYQAYDRRTNIFGYGGYFQKTNTIVVAFRGTESNSIKNWIDDLKNIVMEPYKNSTTLKIGDGWYSSYNSVRSQVLSGVANLVKQNPTAQIYVTGHSLGAALAGTCAIDLIENGYRNVVVYDYGEPRLGNQAMANYLQQNLPSYYRVVNGRDIVPDLPYEFLGFRHQPTEVWEYPAETINFKVCNSTNGEDPKCSDSVIRDSVYDHLHYYGIAEGCSGSW